MNYAMYSTDRHTYLKWLSSSFCARFVIRAIHPKN